MLAEAYSKRLQTCNYMYLFLESYVSSERTISHIVLYYQQLSIACYQVSFHDATIFFYKLPNVSSALNQMLVL